MTSRGALSPMTQCPGSESPENVCNGDMMNFDHMNALIIFSYLRLMPRHIRGVHFGVAQAVIFIPSAARSVIPALIYLGAP